MNIQVLRDKIDSDSELTALDDNYVAIAEILNEKPLIDNPDPVQQVPDLPSFEQLTYLATGDEWAAINQIKKVDDWATPRIDLDEITAPSSDETKALLRAIAATAPDQWEGSMFDLIRHGLENIQDTETYPRINGQLITPDPTPEDPNPQSRSLLNAIGVVLIEQNILSLATFQAMAARLQQTKDDPDYSAQIQGQSWGEENGFGTVLPDQVRRAKNLR